MKKEEKQPRNINVLTDVICDSCGESCKKDGVDFEYMELKANWGYDSNKDMEQWTAQVCEKCVDEKFGFIKFEKAEIGFQTYLGTDKFYQNQMEKFTDYKYDFNPEGKENPPDKSIRGEKD